MLLVDRIDGDEPSSTHTNLHRREMNSQYGGFYPERGARPRGQYARPKFCKN